MALRTTAETTRHLLHVAGMATVGFGNMQILSGDPVGILTKATGSMLEGIANRWDHYAEARKAVDPAIDIGGI